MLSASLAAGDVLSPVLERYRRASMRSVWLRERQKACANAIHAKLNATRTYPRCFTYVRQNSRVRKKGRGAEQGAGNIYRHLIAQAN